MPKEVPLPQFESVYFQLQGIISEIYKEMAATRLALVRPDIISSKVAENPETSVPASESIHTKGKLRCNDGFEQIRIGDDYYDLRKRRKAQLCIEYLFNHQAFNAASARHFLKEIDPYVRKMGDYRRSKDIRIDHYFAGRKGQLFPKLRDELIRAAPGRKGKFYLKTD
jgi:hypothetical protein